MDLSSLDNDDGDGEAEGEGYLNSLDGLVNEDDEVEVDVVESFWTTGTAGKGGMTQDDVDTFMSLMPDLGDEDEDD